jgi:hypothetical protein
LTRLLGWTISEWEFDCRQEKYYLVQTDSGLNSESYSIGRGAPLSLGGSRPGHEPHLSLSNAQCWNFRTRLAVTLLISSFYGIKVWNRHIFCLIIEIYVYVIYIFFLKILNLKCLFSR